MVYCDEGNLGGIGGNLPNSYLKAFRKCVNLPNLLGETTLKTRSKANFPKLQEIIRN
jgi:hypothetical protein